MPSRNSFFTVTILYFLVYLYRHLSAVVEWNDKNSSNNNNNNNNNHHSTLVVHGFHVTTRSQNGDDRFNYMNDVSYSTYQSTGTTQVVQLPGEAILENDILSSTTTGTTATVTTKLVPISIKPLLLVSSDAPVLSPQECELLSSYFLSKQNQSSALADDRSQQQQEQQQQQQQVLRGQGQRILDKLRRTLDRLILREENDTIVEPRFLFYETSG
jgi:hypothetical protein